MYTITRIIQEYVHVVVYNYVDSLHLSLVVSHVSLPVCCGIVTTMLCLCCLDTHYTAAAAADIHAPNGFPLALPLWCSLGSL